VDLVAILRQAGFSGQALNTAYAIAMAESSGNPRAFNGNRKTGDRSFGLFQINMLGGMGPERRKQFGLSADDDLYDPLTNARAAYKLSNGGRNWHPWSTYNNNSYQKYLGQHGATVTTTTQPPGSRAVPGAPAAPQPPAQPDIIGSPGGSGFAPQINDFAPGSRDPADPVRQPAPAAPALPKLGAAAGAAVGAGGATSFRDKVIAAAMGVLGTPYSWGGGGTKGASEGFGKGRGIVGFDCSSLVMYAFAQAGFRMPRTGRPQLRMGERTSISNLRPGDLVGWGDGYHIAIYIGNGKVIQSPTTGRTVEVSTLSKNTKAWGVRLNLPGD
jgi:cell wall-associated NlpC family hydrolase